MNEPSKLRLLRRLTLFFLVTAAVDAHAQDATPGSDVLAVGFPNHVEVPRESWCDEYPPQQQQCPDTMFGGCDVEPECAEAIDAHFQTPGDARLLSAVDNACLEEDQCGETAARMSRLVDERAARIAGFTCDTSAEMLALVSTDPVLDDASCRERVAPHFRTLAAQRCEVLAKTSQCSIVPVPLDTRCAVSLDQVEILSSRETALCAWTEPAEENEDGYSTMAYLATCPRVSNGEDEAQCLSALLMRERIKNEICEEISKVPLTGLALASEPLSLTMSAPVGIEVDDACLFGRALDGVACGPSASGVRVGHAAYYERVAEGPLGRVAAFFAHRDDAGRLSVVRFDPTLASSPDPQTPDPVNPAMFFGTDIAVCTADEVSRLTAQAYQLRRMAVASETGPAPLASISKPVLLREPSDAPVKLGDCGWQETEGLLCWRHLAPEGEAKESLTTWRPLGTHASVSHAEAEVLGPVLEERMARHEGEVHVVTRTKERSLTWTTAGGGFAAHVLSPSSLLHDPSGTFDAGWLEDQLDQAPVQATSALGWWLDRAPLTAASPIEQEARVCWRQGAPGHNARLLCGVYGTDAGITDPLATLAAEDRRRVTDLVGQSEGQRLFERLAELPRDCLIRWIEREKPDLLHAAFLLDCGAGRDLYWISVNSPMDTRLTLSDPGAMALLADPLFATADQARAHHAGSSELRLHIGRVNTGSTTPPVLSAKVDTCTKVRETDIDGNPWIDLGDLLAPERLFSGTIPEIGRVAFVQDCFDNPTAEACSAVLLSLRPFLKEGQALPQRVNTGLSCDG